MGSQQIAPDEQPFVAVYLVRTEEGLEVVARFAPDLQALDANLRTGMAWLVADSLPVIVRDLIGPRNNEQ